jgi:hypothetical protein
VFIRRFSRIWSTTLAFGTPRPYGTTKFKKKMEDYHAKKKISHALWIIALHQRNFIE